MPVKDVKKIKQQHGWARDLLKLKKTDQKKIDKSVQELMEERAQRLAEEPIEDLQNEELLSSKDKGDQLRDKNRDQEFLRKQLKGHGILPVTAADRKAREEIKNLDQGKDIKDLSAGGKQDFKNIAARLRADKAREATSKEQIAQQMAAKMPGGKIASEAIKIQQTIKRLKRTYQIVKGASACTLVGIIITFIVLNLQLIFGNLLKNKWIPKLEWPEIFLVVFLNFLGIVIYLVNIFVLIILPLMLFLS